VKVPSGGHLALLGRYLGPRWRRVLALAVLLVVSIILQLSGPQILRYFIDTATSGHAFQIAFITPSLAVAALLYLGIALAGQSVALIEAYVAENLAWSATNQLRADLTLHCLRLDIGFHKAHTPGELIERLDGDVSLLANCSGSACSSDATERTRRAPSWPSPTGRQRYDAPTTSSSSKMAVLSRRAHWPSCW